MKKRVISVALLLALVLALSPHASAAVGQNKVFTEDTVWKEYGSFIAYDSVTVRAGVTVTVDKDFGLEIMDRLTVEPGGKFVCNGEGSVQFNFSMKHRGSEVTGVELYYPQRRDDGTVSYERIPEPFSDTWTQSEAWAEMSPQFKWNAACGNGGGWCLTWSMAGNPFNIKLYHTARDMDIAERTAMQLKDYGLLRGVGENPDGTTNFALTRHATRAEGLVMLLRMLGKEDEVLAGAWSHPFSDGGWADQYIGYAYETGLTLGRGDGTFGSSDPITAQQYMTFLLRALGYPENGSALYRGALETAGTLGFLVNDDSPFEVCVRDFWRADMVVASMRALHSDCYDGTPLADALGIQL